MRGATWLAVALVLAACEGAPAPANDAGAGRVGDASPEAAELDLELATGADAWTEFEDGAQVGLHRGCQGSQHVFVSVRVRGPSTGRIVVSLAIRRTRDGEQVSLPFELRLPFESSPTEDVREQLGLTVVVPVPSDVVDEEVTIEGEVRDEVGREASAVRRASVRWGADACG